MPSWGCSCAECRTTRRRAALGAIPLQDPDLAVAELRRLRGLGLAGVEIGTNVLGVGLDDPSLTGFFAAAEDCAAAVFVHPVNPLAPERTTTYGLAFGLARPLETTVAAAALVYGGVLARYPALRVCLTHGGGAIAMLAGRLARGHEILPAVDGLAGHSPQELLRRMWADTLTYDPHSLPLVAQTFGLDHLVLGTDYPLAAAERPAGAALGRAVDDGLLVMPEWRAQLSANGEAFVGAQVAAQAAIGSTGVAS
jgi:aminocarboxymuconate-semialdehyde decarboxylase